MEFLDTIKGWFNIGGVKVEMQGSSRWSRDRATGSRAASS